MKTKRVLFVGVENSNDRQQSAGRFDVIE